MRDATIREIEQFLYREARLLDNRQFHEWLELLTDDLRYWMPIRSNRYPVNSKAITILDGSRYEESEVSSENDLALMDEDKDSLTRRIDRLDTGMAWSEDPPSRTRHIVGNLVIEPLPGGDLKSKTAFILYRSHHETDENIFAGSREDHLRNEDGRWRIYKRVVVLDSNVILAKNLSVFF